MKGILIAFAALSLLFLVYGVVFDQRRRRHWKRADGGVPSAYRAPTEALIRHEDPRDDMRGGPPSTGQPTSFIIG